jgi:lantibiotic transport system permease protein
VPRWSQYAAKLLTGALLLALSLLVLAVGLGLEGLLLNSLRPSLGFAPPVPWLDIFAGVAKMFGASLLLLALLTWIAVRWSSFGVPRAVGIIGTVVGLTLDISVRSDFWARMFPWSMPLSAVMRIDQYRTLEDHVTAIALGVIGGLIVSTLGAWDIAHRDVV